jgi:phospholipase C
MRIKLLFALSSLGLIAGCSSALHPVSQNALPPAAKRSTGSPSQYIKNIVVIIQENRSFENFFAGFPGANAPRYGYAIVDHRRVKVKLRQTTFETNRDLAHDWQAAMSGWNGGKMDGFETANNHFPAYTYMDHPEIAPYWAMAKQYVLADAMFPTEFGGSYTAHLTAVAGTDNMDATHAQANFPTHSPNDCDSPPGTLSSLVNSRRRVGRGNGPFPCFTQWNTAANILDAGGISWHYYAIRLLNGGIWSPFEAISYVRYGNDWNTDIIAPQRLVLKDIKSGNLAQMNWVTPTHPDSDHPGAQSDKGPSWVTSIVNAIGESSYWNSSAIIVIWDDWGGFFDNAPPPQLDFRGLAMRVPCLIISPYARKGNSQGGYVSHTQYEFGSILRFMEQVFNLPYIGPASQGYSDARANSIIDSFDFTQPPRPFTPFGSKYPASYFEHEPPSHEPVDEE